MERPTATRCTARDENVSRRLLSASLLVAVPAATAKDFGPGDLRVCNAKRCVAVVNPDVLPLLGSFYYSGPAPTRVKRSALGAPHFELRFSNGYATGIVATRRLDRFLSYGVHLERFGCNTWYAVPRPLSRELLRLKTGMRPLGITKTALARSR